MPLTPRQTAKRPDNERRALQRRLDKQMDQMAEFGGDRSKAEEVIADWSENATERLEMVLDIAYPADAPMDPTSAAVLLGRIQGFLEPMRKATDTLGLTGQMKLSVDKLRDQINDLGEDFTDEL